MSYAAIVVAAAGDTTTASDTELIFSRPEPKQVFSPPTASELSANKILTDRVKNKRTKNMAIDQATTTVQSMSLPATVTEPFPKQWYHCVMQRIWKKMDGDKALPESIKSMVPARCVVIEPQWHVDLMNAGKYFDKEFTRAEITVGHHMLDRSADAIMRLTYFDMISAYKSLMLHEAGKPCHCCCDDHV